MDAVTGAAGRGKLTKLVRPSRRHVRACRGGNEVWRVAAERQDDLEGVGEDGYRVQQLQRVSVGVWAVGGMLTRADAACLQVVQTVCTRVRFGAELMQMQR